jgi:phosphate ABC transporter phosphate-binding protein
MTRRARRLFRSTIGAIAVVMIVSGIFSFAPQPAAVAAGGAHQPISGAGSTWSANALQQWMRNVQSNFGWQISYNDSGSSAGRQLFAAGTVDFGVSEIPYELAGSDSVDPRPARGFAYMPIVAGGTAFMYNLVIGGNQVTNLRLSGDTLTKIFTGVITVWNDPAVAADNPSLTLPATPIIPVVRSDGSGTSAQFSAWMRQQHADLWNGYCVTVGRGAGCGITSNYPFVAGSKFVGQSGSNNVAGYVAQGQYVGAIGYVEYSYALNSGFPVAKILNGADYYTEPTASNVAVSLLGSQINQDQASPDYLTQNLTGVYNNADPRTYPLSSYSYMIVPTKIEGNFTEDKGLTLSDFANYFLCEGQQEAAVLGYSPLPINLASAGLDQSKRIPGADPAGVNISSCNNPTFSADGSNKLANEAPQPPECDKRGATAQCADGTGGAGGPAAGGGGGAAAGAGAAAAGDAAAGAGAAGASAGSDATAIGGVAGPVTVAGTPVTIQSLIKRTPANAIALVAGVAALVLLLVPPLVVRRRRTLALQKSSTFSVRSPGQKP